jgi:broad specificity phosphatase PhoE
VRRLVLVRHATTSAVRAAAFPADEPLDPAGRRAAEALRGRLGRGGALCGPSERARATSLCAGLDARVVEALDECDFGTWSGRTLASISDADPDAVAAWLAGGAPHGGETLAQFGARVGGWLDEQAEQDGRTIAITSAGVVKAAVVHALDAPAQAFWRIDVAPVRSTELHAHDGRWTVAHLNAPVGA